MKQEENINIDQWDPSGNSGKTPIRFCQLVSNKVLQKHTIKIHFSIQNVENRVSTCRKVKLDLYFVAYKKNYKLFRNWSHIYDESSNM